MRRATKSKAGRTARWAKWGSLAAKRLAVYLILICLSYVVVYQFLGRVLVSVMNEADLNDDTVVFFARHFHLGNYREAIVYMDYWANLLKTGLYVLASALAQVLAATFVGYGFARFRFFGRRLLFAFVILTLIVPPQIIAMPLYFHFQNFNLFGLLGAEGFSLLGKPFPVILLSLTGTGLKSGLIIFMMCQYFSGFPRELEESASIDSAGPLRTFLLIVVPSAKPMLVTSFLFALTWQWTDNFYNSIFMPGNTFLQKQILTLANSISFSSNMGEGAINVIKVSLVNNAGIILYILPLLLVFLFGQRHFIEGIRENRNCPVKAREDRRCTCVG